MQYPWQQSILFSWSIIGMNHYFKDGYKQLFMAMIRGNKFIKEEGVDSKYLWNRLCHKAMDIDNQKIEPIKKD